MLSTLTYTMEKITCNNQGWLKLFRGMKQNDNLGPFRISLSLICRLFSHFNSQDAYGVS
ncbi:hypothetical protein Hanom_Chr03g00269111 [Helianthus anomalus]